MVVKNLFDEICYSKRKRGSYLLLLVTGRPAECPTLTLEGSVRRLGRQEVRRKEIAGAKELFRNSNLLPPLSCDVDTST